MNRKLLSSLLALLVFSSTQLRADMSDEIRAEYQVVFQEVIDKSPYPDAPIVRGGAGFRLDRKTYYYADYLVIALERCIKAKKVSLEEYLRGLFDERDYVRHTCVTYFFKEFENEEFKKAYTPPTKGTMHVDPFKDEEVWNNMLLFRKIVIKYQGDRFRKNKTPSQP